MANSFYTNSGYPGYAANGDSASARSEFAAVEAGFSKLPTLSAGSSLKILRINQAGDAIEAVSLTGYTLSSANFAPTTSAEFATVISDETGSGALVFATSPSLTTPSLGVATATSLTAGSVNITGNTTLGDASTDTVTVNGYMGVGGVGNSSRGLNIVSAALTGSQQFAAYLSPTYTASAVTQSIDLQITPSTVASSFTMGQRVGVSVGNMTLGSGSSLTNQYGIYVNDLTTGTNNYGITSAVSSSTNKWNIYASGTAANYFAGDVVLGSATAPAWTAGSTLSIASTGTTSGAYGELGLYSAATGSGATTGGINFGTTGVSDSTAVGRVGATIGATNEGTQTTYARQGLAFYTNAGAGAGVAERLRIDSAGNVGIGTNAPGTYKLNVTGGQTGFNIVENTTYATAASVPFGALSFGFNNNTAGAGIFGGHVVGVLGGTAAGQYAYWGALSTASGFAPDTVFGARSASGAFTERLRIDSAGNITVSSVAGLGYGAGSGGTVTQGTSRTTGVTLSKPTGAITLFTAAGSTTATTFTVTNTLVAATDVVKLCQKSGTNLYITLVTAVGAGSFNITFYTTGGTASDAPVFNFVLIKGVTA